MSPSADEMTSVSQPSTSNSETPQQKQKPKKCLHPSQSRLQQLSGLSVRNIDYHRMMHRKPKLTRGMIKFQDKRLKHLKRLYFDPEENAMTCKLCVKYNKRKRNTMT